MCSQIPIINIKPLIDNTNDTKLVSQQIADALKTWGFFYITGHGVDVSLQQQIDDLSQQFYAQPLEEKIKLTDKTGAYRGYLGIVPEFFSGKQSTREALFFWNDSNNIYPKIPNFRETIDRYASEMTKLMHKLFGAIAMSLGLSEDYFENLLNETATVLTLSNYPPVEELAFYSEDREYWGIGEHTDYGLFTIVKQDNSGGLQVKSLSNQWIDATPIDNTFVCNIGDMLDKMTGGLYRSTMHRVVGTKGRRARKSIPFFVNPNLNARISLIEGLENTERAIIEENEERWDGMSVYKFSGTYGEYLKIKSMKSNTY